MKNKIMLAALAAMVLAGCSVPDNSAYVRNSSAAAAGHTAEFFPFALSSRAPGLAYDDYELADRYSRNYAARSSTTEWRGTGFNPEGPPGTEGQTPPAFRDMSNLYGEMRAENITVSVNAGDSAPNAQINNTSERKLVKQASLRMRAENLEAAETFVSEVMEKHNAYSASTVMEENQHHYSIRVPSAAYDVFLSEIAILGRMQHRYESVEDVTLRYYDIEERLATQRELLITFQSYLGRARNIDEILSVERRIAELQREIDRSGRDLRDLSHNIEYSVVELLVLGPIVPSAQYQGVTLAERVKETFSGFGNFASVIIVALISIIVYGIPIALLLAFLTWILFGRIGLLKKLWRLAIGKKAK